MSYILVCFEIFFIFNQNSCQHKVKKFKYSKDQTSARNWKKITEILDFKMCQSHDDWQSVEWYLLKQYICYKAFVIFHVMKSQTHLTVCPTS